MIIVILTPSVYCVEMSESSGSDDTTESSQADTTSEEDPSSTSDDQSSEESLETEEDSTEEITTSEATIETTSTSTEEIASLVESKNYLDPTIENDNDYFDTSLFTGSFIYSYPIETVAGKGGLEPKISFTYSSSSGLKGTYGSLGSGWSLNDNCIIRDVRHSPENTSDDRFILTLDGSSYELIYVEEDGLYHTKVESFMKISRNITNTNSFGEYWIVKTSDGTNYRFGYNNDSEQRNSVESRNYVSKWWMDQIEDVNENQVQYNYVENPDNEEIGSTYLSNISYNDGNSIVDFDYKQKIHSFDLYEYGNRIKENNILSAVIIYNNQTLLWKYNLKYEYKNSKLFLSTITKQGSNNHTFPSTSFKYDSLSKWEQNDSWNLPGSMYTSDRGHRFADVNGDGLVDYVLGYRDSNGDETHTTWINTGSGWTVNSSWAVPTCFRHDDSNPGSLDSGARFADVNGDGLIDIVQNGLRDSAWINNGTGWEENTSWIPPVEFEDEYDSGIKIIDINGDGLADIIALGESYINNGAGWELNSSWKSPTSFTYDEGRDTGARLAEVNGDGLIDIIKYTDLTKNVWINNGTGWETDNSWDPPMETEYAEGVYLEDLNGDGLTDFIRSHHYRLRDYYESWINTGEGWEQDNSWNTDFFLWTNGVNIGYYFVDLNGDGLVDIAKSDSGQPKHAWINSNNNPYSTGYETNGLLKVIHHSTGSNTTIKYEPSTNFDNTGNDDISDLPVNVWVTSQIIRDNGIEGTGNLVSTTNYSYKDGMQYYDAPEEIEFRGFGKVTVENNYSITKHAFHQDDILKGIENHTEVWDKNGNLYSTSDREYSTQELYSDVNLILLENESSTQFDGLTRSLNDPIGWSSYKEYDEYDDYGNPLSVTEYGDLDVTGDERYFHYEYVNDEDDWILGKTAHEWVEDDDHVNCSESWYYFDDTEDNSDLDRGLLTKVVSWNNNGNDPSVQYDYDSYGNIIEITDAKGSSQTIEYDENHVYPVSIENSLGQKESYEYNDLGRITKITDSNGISINYIYDDLYRISQIITPYDDESFPTMKYTYYQDGTAPETVHTCIKDDVNMSSAYVVNNPSSINFSLFTSNKIITISPSSDETLRDYPMSFNISYEPEMQPDFDDVRFADEDGVLLPYWIESMIYSSSAKVWVKIPEIDITNGTTFKMCYGNSIVESESDGHDVFEFFDDFSSSLEADKWTTVYNTPDGGSCDVGTEDGKLKVSVRGPTYAVKAEAYARTQASFNFENTPLEIEYFADQVISSGCGMWWKSGFILSNDTTMPHQTSGGGHYIPDNGISIRQPRNGYSSEGAAINVDSYVDTSATSIYYTSDNPGSHKFNLIVDKENVTVRVDDVIVTENVKHNITDYDSYIYFLRASDQEVWNTQKWDYIIVRQHAANEPTYSVSETIDEVHFIHDKTRIISSTSDISHSTFLSVDYYDGFGQLIQTKYEGEDDWITQSTTYNELGLVSSTEVPHYINESGQSITYQYDPIGRPTVITNTDNTTLNYHYELENTTITNQNGVNKTLTSDIYGNIAKVYEFNEGETYVTSYSYDAMDNLIEIIPDIQKYNDSLDFRLSGSSNSKTIIVSPSSDGTLTDYQMNFDIDYEPEMQTDFDDLRFTDEDGVLLPYWIEEKTNSTSAKIWVKIPVIDGTNDTVIKMHYGNPTVSSAENGDNVFEFFDDFSSSLDTNKWITAYNTPNGGSYDVATEDGKLKVSVRGPSYAVQADAYAKTQASFNFENTPLEIEYSADQVISSGEGAWWYSGFIFSNDTTMHPKYCGGHYVPDNGIAIRQPLDGYGSTGAAINVNSYVDSSSTSIYHTTDNPGSHKFNLIMDKENVTLYVDDVMVAENVEHNLVDYDSYIYFLRSSDQYIWNTQKWDYVIVRQHAFNEPTYVISDSELGSFSDDKIITISPSSDGNLTDYQMSFTITYEPEMQTDFDDLRFTDEYSIPIPYWIESMTNSSSAKVWVKVPEIKVTSGATIKMYYGNSTVESESNGDEVFEFFDDFSSSLDIDKWTTAYNTPDGGSYDVVTEDGKLKVSARGPSYAVQADAYAKTKESFNYESTPLEIEYSADQVISSGEGAWWYSGFIFSNDTTMPHKYCGGSYVPDNGIAIRQPLDGYGSTGTAINVNSYVDSSSTSIYHTTDNPGSHKFNLIMDKENVTLYVDDVMVAENVEHNLVDYDSYIYFLRSSDQFIWNTQKWDYVIVRQHAFNEPTYVISDSELGSFSNAGRVYFTYDSLGRKIAMNDPDMGNWTYEYDLNGNLINQTDARGISTLLSYDALDRLTAIDYPNDEDVTFTYDLQYNGTLSQVTRGGVSSSYDYDQRYRVLNETMAMDGTGYTTSYEYDSMDRPTTITYPDGNSVNLTYNAQTLLESVEGVVDNLDYNARNQITTKELSNGVVTSYTYDAEKLLLDRIYTESLQDLNYDFDNVGNILEIEDNVMDSVKTYGYDDLDRLTSAGMSVNSVSTYQRDFSYDQYGCIQQVDENNVTISSYGYASVPFHAPVTYNGNDLVYDSNGNLVEDEDFIYFYNDANQLSEVRYSGNSSLVEKYWYDANGQRVKKQNSAGEFTYYVNQFYEIENGTATSYFFRDDERIAKETSGDMEWYLSDHLGSTTLLINESGLEIERTEYYPYGEVQSGGLEKYGFTGQENDADTELMYYGARYYSPEYRVFVQPDTMLPDPYNPQALNRYAYTLNNPVKYDDASGHFVDIALDAGFIVVDLVELYSNPTDPWAWAALGADVACAALPVVTGGGLAVKGLKAANKLDDTADTLRIVDKSVEAGKTVEKGVDVVDTLADGRNVANNGDVISAFNSVPESLLGGEANTYVYYGITNNEKVYVGITNNIERRSIEHQPRFDEIIAINNEALTRRQARAIEQAEIINNPSFENKINSISPVRDYYDEAVEWGQKWLRDNT